MRSGLSTTNETTGVQAAFLDSFPEKESHRCGRHLLRQTIKNINFASYQSYNCIIVKKLIVRILSGSVYIALIIASILLFPVSPTVFLGVMSLFAVIGTHELYKLIEANDKRHHNKLLCTIDMAGCITLIFGMHYITATECSAPAILPFMAYLLVRSIVMLYQPAENAISNAEKSFMALVYVALPLSLLSSIATMTNPRMVLALFIFIWVNDSGAFLLGSLAGHHRLFERISPKKSWEGFWGGLIACVLASWLIFAEFNDFFIGPSLATWVGLAIVTSVFATFGDLMESLFKRTAGVKDSGRLIPGHGGILDRIDSLLMVVPAALSYFLILTFIFNEI